MSAGQFGAVAAHSHRMARPRHSVMRRPAPRSSLAAGTILPWLVRPRALSQADAMLDQKQTCRRKRVRNPSDMTVGKARVAAGARIDRGIDIRRLETFGALLRFRVGQQTCAFSVLEQGIEIDGSLRTPVGSVAGTIDCSIVIGSSTSSALPSAASRAYVAAPCPTVLAARMKCWRSNESGQVRTTGARQA